MQTQLKYYYEMYDIKVCLIYFSKCLEWCKSLDKWLQIIVTIITITGISVLQEKFSDSVIWFYSMIFCQIAALILSLFFDAKSKIVKIEILLEKLNALYLKMIDDWKKVSEGELTTNEIHKLWINFKKEKESIETPSGTIGYPWYLKSAEKEAMFHFKKYYSVEVNNE